MDINQIISQLKSHSNPKNIAGMARFGINSKNTLGVNIPVLRQMAKEIKKNVMLNFFQDPNKKILRSAQNDKLHGIAQKLWDSQIHEARILASMIDVPELVTAKQMNEWVADFDSWDVCDQVCMNLFDKTKHAYQKAVEWSSGKSAFIKSQQDSGETKEFVKRAGFALMAVLAWHDKESPDNKFLQFLLIIKKESTDERNYVKKAVNWALRQIGKGRPNLLNKCLQIAADIKNNDSKSARWIANDAIRELQKYR